MICQRLFCEHPELVFGDNKGTPSARQWQSHHNCMIARV
jgi:hypothetical protein